MKIKQKRSCLKLLGTFFVALFAFANSYAAPAQDSIPIPGHIVVFKASTNDVKGKAKGLGKANGFAPSMFWEKALKGFFIPVDLPDAAIKALQKNPNIAYIKKNMKYRVHFNAQTVDFGLQRVLAPQVGKIDGIDDQANVTVAVVEPVTPQPAELRIDMNLSFGFEEIWEGKNHKRRFVGWGPMSHDPQWWEEDHYPHGTHVSGTVAAIDNDQGVVGIAEGATIVVADFFDEHHQWLVENLAVEGFNYLAQNADTIAAMNMSWRLGSQSQPVDDAIQGCIDAGIVAVAAAGNEEDDFHDETPRSVPGVIVVSSIVDTDGFPLGLGQANYYGPDDSFSSFSNYGSRIDIAAPGTDIISLIHDGGTGTMSGTSMSAPHVTGAVALYVATHGRDTNGDSVINGTDVANIKALLLLSGWQQGSLGYFTGDPDSYPEPLLDVEAFVSGGGTGMSVAITSPTEGATVSGNVDITADASDDGSITKVEFYVDDSLIGTDTDGTDGWTATWDSTTLSDGNHFIEATATDNDSNTLYDEIGVFSNNMDEVPFAHAGSDQSVNDSDADGSETVTLDGTGSLDDDAIVLYEWFENDQRIALGATPNVSFGIGTHIVTLTVTDTNSQTDSDTVSITVTDQSSSFIESITLTGSGGRNQNKDLTVTTQLVDEWGFPLSGATIAAELYQDGQLYMTQDGVNTDNNGETQLFFKKNAPVGCYSVNIISVNGPLPWDGFTPDNLWCK